METWFAPAERLPEDEWNRQVADLADHPLVNILLDAVEGYLVVLNEARQVLAANQEFLDLLGFEDLSGVPGRRFGELLGCQNSRLTEGGCGTTPDCAHCGALLATLAVLETQETVEKECRMCTLSEGVHGAREFRVKASPLVLGDSLFVVVVFQDISSEKRRRVLEQVFLHDLGNLLGGLSGFSELLTLQNSDDHVAGKVVLLSRLLRGELESQVLLSRAEAGDFNTRIETVDIGLVVRDVAEVFSENPCARGKAWRTLTDGVSSCRTDRAVVVRILVNMVKNAYEASEPGDEVVLEAVSRGAGVRFTVTNSAVMAPEVAVHVFERSFTTKEIPGRGLGTYAMRLLAEGFLGASVTFTSVPGEGTRFHLDLP